MAGGQTRNIASVLKCKGSNQAENKSARDKCTGRCDVTNTDRSPRTLPRAQKPLRSLTRAHALAQIDYFHLDPWDKSRYVKELGSLVPRSTARSQGLNRAVMQVQQSATPLRTDSRGHVVLKHA